MHTCGGALATGRALRQPALGVRCSRPKRVMRPAAAPRLAVLGAASLGQAGRGPPPADATAMMKEARRSEVQLRIAAAKSRLLLVQQRLQAQAEAAAAAGGSFDGEAGGAACADAAVRGVLAAAADSAQLRSEPAAAAAATLAARVAADAARADAAAAAAASAAQQEAERQLAALAHLQRQLESVQLPEPSVSPAAPAPRGGWGALDLLLAPAAPLAAALAGARSHSAAAWQDGRRNKYDALLDLVAAAVAAAPQADGRYEPVRTLLRAVPAGGAPRSAFARSLLRGLLAAREAGGTGSGAAFDATHDLLQSVRDGSVVLPGAAQHDPAWALLREAALLEAWGAGKYDPLAGLGGWGAAPGGAAFLGLRADPWADLVAAAREGAAAAAAPGPPPKYDMLGCLLAGLAAAPAGGRARHRYDPAAELLALGACPEWQGPTGASPYCPLSAALDAAAGWQPPSGAERYCPLSAALAAEPPAAAGRWAPLAWLLDGWAANSDGWQEEAAATADDDGWAAVVATAPAAPAAPTAPAPAAAPAGAGAGAGGLAPAFA